MLPDYYSNLEIPRTATQLEIKAAYRSLAKLHHPDKHGGAPSKERLFKEINEAYEILSNTEKKMAYDKQLYWQDEHGSFQTSRPRPPYYPPPSSQQPYHYDRPGYSNIRYVYSKWTLMYGKIFVIGLVWFAIMFPFMLEYWGSIFYYNRAMEALDNNNYFEAEINLKDAMRDWGGRNTLAALKAAEMMLDENSNQKALGYVKIGHGFSVKRAHTARLFYFEGVAHSRLGQSLQADTAFHKAIEWGFDKDSVYRQMGPLYTYGIRDYEKSVEIYNYLIEVDDNYEHYLHRGYSEQKIKQHRQAVDDFNVFLNNKGINGSVLYLKAISQVSLNEIDSACKNFRRSEELGVYNARAFIRLYCDTTRKEMPVNPF
ncbi:MAG: DnaJ domain-containing protein [Bacteroidota bacterium]